MSTHLSGVIPTPTGSLSWVVQSYTSPSLAKGSSFPEWLSSEEGDYWATLKTEKRRRDWALGRRTGKRLVIEFLKERTGRLFADDQVVIMPHGDGWPLVAIPALNEKSPPITLSISHSHEYVFCAVMEGPEKPLGVDIEKIEPRTAAFIEDYFTLAEQTFLNSVTTTSVATTQLDTTVNTIWSGKEAALKAIRRGLAEDTRTVSSLPHPSLTDETEWLPMRIVWNNIRHERPKPELGGLWRTIDGFVLTIAYAV